MNDNKRDDDEGGSGSGDNQWLCETVLFFHIGKCEKWEIIEWIEMCSHSLSALIELCQKKNSIFSCNFFFNFQFELDSIHSSFSSSISIQIRYSNPHKKIVSIQRYQLKSGGNTSEYKAVHLAWILNDWCVVFDFQGCFHTFAFLLFLIRTAQRYAAFVVSKSLMSAFVSHIYVWHSKFHATRELILFTRHTGMT